MSGMCSPEVRVVQKSAVTNIGVIILSHKMGKWVRNNLEMLMGPNWKVKHVPQFCNQLCLYDSIGIMICPNVGFPNFHLNCSNLYFVV